MSGLKSGWLVEDRPVYRSQRMLYPALAGAGGLLRPWAILWAMLTLAVLAREAMLLVVAGAALWLWLGGERRKAVVFTAIPALVAGLWALYVRIRVGDVIDGPQIKEIGLPFRGFIEALSSAWQDDPMSMITGCMVMALLVMFTLVVARTRSLVGLVFVGFVALAVSLTEQVWASHWDIKRAIAPLFTAVVLVVLQLRRHAPVRVEA